MKIQNGCPATSEFQVNKKMALIDSINVSYTNWGHTYTKKWSLFIRNSNSIKPPCVLCGNPKDQSSPGLEMRNY